MADWIPRYLNFKVSNKSHQSVDADYWNALWNTVIAGLDNTTTGTKWLMDNAVLGVKGDYDEDYQHGYVILTKANIGLDQVDNTADRVKRVAYADDAGTVGGHAVLSDVPANAVFITPEGVDWSTVVPYVVELLEFMTDAEVDAIFEA